MAVYLGYTVDYDDSDLVGHGRSLRRVRAAVEAGIGVHEIEATPEITVAEQIERRKRIADDPTVVATSDMRPIGSLLPIPARPREVRADVDGRILRVRAFSIAVSVARLVDDGVWNYHYEWSEWSPM